jgi:hypothetical protein
MSVPAYAHIVVVMMENHDYNEIIGNSSAPYINSLAAGGALLSNYTAISHPSEPNYFALYAGSTFGVVDDNAHSEPDPSLATILQGAGKTFIGYIEPASPAKHNPWESFPEAFTVEKNFNTTFPASPNFANLPSVSFVVPDLNDDMHDGTIQQGDTWLQNNIDSYAQWAKTHNSLLILTFDEGDVSPNNQVATIFYGAQVASGTYNTAYNHFNMLSTVLAASNLTGPNNAATASPIQVFDMIVSPPPPPPPPPSPPLAPVIVSFSPDSGGVDATSSIVLTGTAEANSTVAVYDGSSNLGTTPVDASGNWSFTENNAVNGVHTFTATDTDVNGTSGLSTPFAVTVDVPSPPPPPPSGNPAPPAGTTADMILRSGNGTYEIYDIGNNAILAGYKLGQVGTDWTVAGLGSFFGNDTTDMLSRNSNTGAFEVYDISNNNITNAVTLGTVGLNWQVAGFADFNRDGMTDMMLRNSNTGAFEIYNISNNSITNTVASGTVGLNWQVGGFGNFSSVPGEADMIMRNTSTGALVVYFNNNQSIGAAFMGTVGVDWQIIGVGNFSSSPGETDMIMRNITTGGLEVYDIANNQITGAAFLGTVGLDWQFAGVAPVHGPGASDLVLRNINSGQFQVYNIANNQITGSAALGSVGLDWQLGGFAADPPAASTASMGGSSQVDQLVQAMAGFGGSSGVADGLNTVPLAADTSQQPLLTTPQHA